MKKEKNIIGIDVYRNRYDACFTIKGTKKIRYYTGSLVNSYGKDRLFSRIKSSDLILINECSLAAELLLRFQSNVIVINNKILLTIEKAKIPRGRKMALFFVKNLVNETSSELSKKMKDEILIEGDKLITLKQKLLNDSLEVIDDIEDGKKIDFSRILEMENTSRKLNNTGKLGSNKIDDIEKMIRNFEKLNEIL